MGVAPVTNAQIAGCREQNRLEFSLKILIGTALQCGGSASAVQYEPPVITWLKPGANEISFAMN